MEEAFYSKVNAYIKALNQQIHEEAQEAYLNNAHTQLTRYMSRSAKRKRIYAVGDIVGLNVAGVDRTNTSSTILPCKIVHSNNQNGETLYTVTTKNGIIKDKLSIFNVP
ncbi:unnamed protein product [Rotaria magnacalcarata]|uniref:Uncharacterized protein n=1 Tax=Rotaria magnacalcarata TaxID=392030 RepID=A0A820R4E9_9BILA|nr:unnamed protein product [Rotaria magnacalcarata]CAF4429407.1 unnamed protein product [Rotaria magnacalcarata]CAF5066817.1 unnamed protein product [Rotaria magnacalcarata]CAF5223464.1 unnamed protein product [Rotaria magnacalcarata]